MEPGNGRITPWYLAWDGLTFAWFITSAWLVLGTERTDFLLQWTLLFDLLLVTAMDLWVLRKLYFWPDQRREEGAS